MDYKVVWSPRAIDDVEAIAEYISRDSLAYAAAVVRRIIATTRSVGRLPLAGRMVPEFSDDKFANDSFMTIVSSIVLENTEVTIATVIHGRRTLPLKNIS